MLTGDRRRPLKAVTAAVAAFCWSTRTWDAGRVTDVLAKNDGSVWVIDGGERLGYFGREVIAPDGSTIKHESLGGSLVSVWAAGVGDAFVEISHLGDGPEGGELVMVVTPADGTPMVALGGLVTETIPEDVPPSWPEAIDLALGLIVDTTLDSGPKDDIDAFHQRLLGVLFG